MKRQLLKFCAATFLLLFIFGCGSRGGSGSDGASSAGTGDTSATDGSVSVTRLDLTTDNYMLNTNGLDSATLTIVTRDASNAAIGDVTVNLSASAGLLSASQVTTDSDTGTATVTFSPGPEKTNQVVTVTASTGTLSKTLPISLVGTTLTLTSTKNSLLAGAGDSTVLTVKALDANENPIPNETITISSSMGNSLTAGTVTTGPSGMATATLTALATPGTDTITASGLGAQTSLPITITNAQFGFTYPANDSTIAVAATTDLTVTWTDAAGTPLDGEVLTFITTGGYFDGIIGKVSTTAVTGAVTPGEATVSFTAGNTTSPVDITVTTSGSETDTLRLQVASTDPSQLSLQAAPSVLGPSIGELSSSSTITATVRDLSGQLISGETVIFTLISGPGGGETLSPGSAVTDSGGTASVTFTSGSAVSAQDGVRIRATLLSDPTIFADTTLTIGKSAASIVLGSTNKIAKVSVDGLEIGYALPFSVLVVDINGNPIPNATVNLGIYPLFFYTGLNATGWTGKFMNEDVNRNGLLDPGEDGAPGWSDPTSLRTDPTDIVWYKGSELTIADLSSGLPNGRLDPGGVVTIPDTVVTDEDGLAAFQIKYAKSFATWVFVEITATTQVTGDLSVSKIETPLSAAQNDAPYPDSPFGY